MAQDQDFLDLEATASELIEVLEDLRSEVEGYATARASLAESSSGIAGAADHVGRSASALEETARALREIGTPHLVADHRRLESKLDAIQAELRSLRRLSLIGFVAVGLIAIAGVVASLI